jgi:Uma2 family endonuclease
MSDNKYDLDETGTTLNEEAFSYKADKEQNKQGEYTLIDYYALPDDRRVELIDGVFYDMASPRTVHQDITGYFHMALYQYIKDKKKPCKVFESPIDVQLDCDDKTMVEPDVIVVCDRDKIKGFAPVSITDGDLKIDLKPVAEIIKELRDLE